MARIRVDEPPAEVNVWLAYSDLFSGMLLVLFVVLVVVEAQSGQIIGAQERANKLVRLFHEAVGKISVPGMEATPEGLRLREETLFRSGGYQDFRGTESGDLLLQICKTVKQVIEKNLTPEERATFLFVVEGHTDDQPIKKGSALAQNLPTNWELSSRRATEVVRYFEERCGLNAEEHNIIAIGYGPYRPRVPSLSPDGKPKSSEEKAENRRIELKLVPNYERLVGSI